jgi:hypothetical protein
LYLLRAHAKFRNPKTIPSGVLTTVVRKIPKIVAYLSFLQIPKIVATFIYASSQGQHMHSARTKMTGLLYAGQAHVRSGV